MALETVTQVKRALIVLFQARLREKLDRYDAAHDDGVITASPAVYYDCEKKIVESYPSVEVFPTAAAPSGGESYVHIYRNRFVIGFRYAGDDEVALQRQAEALMWALRHVARDTHLETTDEDGDAQSLGAVDTGNEEFTMLPTPPGFEVPFVKGGYIEMFVTTVEES